MSTHAALGQKALDAGDYPLAITHYTSALASSPTSPDYYIKRSTAHQRASSPASALADAEIAVVAAHARGRRELILSAQFRRAIALLSLERYADAKFLFEAVEAKGLKENSLGIYKTKVEGKLEGLEEGDERGVVSVKEVPDVEIPVPAKKEKGVTGKASSATAAVKKDEGVAAVKEAATTIPSRIKHDWYQTADKVTVTLLAKNAPKEKTTVHIETQSISISFPTSNDSTFEFSIDPLAHPINPSTSAYTISPSKIELTLSKASPRKWSALESAEPTSSPPSTQPTTTTSNTAIPSSLKPLQPHNPAPKETAPSYPTSSKSGPKNWDKLAAKMASDDAGGEGSDEVGDFFKTLYSGADPDTRRAMMKSYQESNGTVLSTNWSEVGAKHVDVAPPDGMVERKWDA